MEGQMENIMKNIKNIRLLTTVFALLLTAYSLQLISPAHASSYIAEPTGIAVGARALSLGRAYVGIAENGEAVFANPAGIALITGPKVSAMYSSVMGDVGYSVLSGAYPINDKAALGLGFASARLSGIPITDSTGNVLGTGGWGNHVLTLSYGTFLSAFNPNFNKDILLGANLKYVSVGGEGTTVSTVGGTALNADLGVLFPVNNQIMLGGVFQNILVGSKLNTSGGSTDDTLAPVLKLGSRFNLIGESDKAFFSHATRKLYLSVDGDINLSSKKPSALYAGLEFWPVESLALRAGADNGDLTAGIGIRYSGVEFNYAYHPYSEISENTTHYFSFGYLGEDKKREYNVLIESPADKSIVYSDNVAVTGRIEGFTSSDAAKNLTVKVNDINAVVSPDGKFQVNVPVNQYGKKLLVVKAYDTEGNAGAKDLRIVRLTSFADVPEGYWAKMPIENNATVGLVQGYPDGNFKPERPLTRAELATLLVRAKGIDVKDDRARQVFKDVKSDFWAAKYIEIAQREGLVKGYPDKSFRPNNKISKAEGIAVLVRFDKLPLAEANAKPYWDVPAYHWAARYIEAAKSAGMLNFVSDNRFNPKQAMLRSQTVEVLGKTSLAGAKIKDLYEWEKGFAPSTIQERPTLKASLY
ncbi:hypothetical protein A3K48_04670 [candidate division WOR-1 bacterium RIFOXYA12_FULL_52_29]|uniref:SLH domain-containing protein n=1 Tax=candidate division WOR-1 bacterium RIFOXYC12_FULL_54_18 TaxID=1802584 RepID=A0A1F4T6W2_UNCSA|nr:MAG: hypothetical protein A3K44_04670 [candidate division WOR-1 bacterium RIFOXYA2_FULL_51_19]OGC17842.1 MAG: hypothetical protein A3K48_04670 [candidate division WOR-1 bacterium RIFOXYA12_FULL_52_29]OGC28259.1 MAG: hypothetical protein A3K49_04670 [candidate division WOR-1 bacterium RIFOXYC12_FULL_54_18]